MHSLKICALCLFILLVLFAIIPKGIPQAIADSQIIKEQDYTFTCNIMTIDENELIKSVHDGSVITYRLVITNIGKQDLSKISFKNHQFSSPIIIDTPLHPGDSWIYNGTQTITQADINKANELNKDDAHSCFAVKNTFQCNVINLSSKVCSYAVPTSSNNWGSIRSYNKRFNGYVILQPDNDYDIVRVKDPQPELGADDHLITVYHRDTAKDPTYNDLLAFLWQETSDQHEYLPNAFVCADFAEQVQHNAIARNIRCGWVGINYMQGTGHACNAFNTTDKGQIFIDCTHGTTLQVETIHDSWDQIANIEVGKQYTTKNAYGNMKLLYNSHGIVKDYNITW